jgi:expansin (peptidoglycan-binding protein)
VRSAVLALAVLGRFARALAIVVLAASPLGPGGCGTCSRRAPPDAAAQCAGDPISGVGDGTHYDADGTGNCSFEASPGDRMIAALNGPDYARAAWCGACLAVSGPNGEVVVRVVDQCPGCKRGDLDLSREAFARIAPLSAGRVRIAWREVACPVSGPIAYHLKSGSSAFWVAIQVRNHRHAIERLEARGTAGYQAIARADYNYFVMPGGLGPGPLALRITDVRGQVLEDSAIALGDGVLRPGAGQFPACPQRTE